jgi:hypothetical protein
MLFGDILNHFYGIVIRDMSRDVEKSTCTTLLIHVLESFHWPRLIKLIRLINFCF